MLEKRIMYLSLVFFLFVSLNAIGVSAWWNTNWEKSQNLTINNTLSMTMPMKVISVNFTRPATAAATCGDIRFTDANDNEINYTLVVCGASSMFDVKVPTLAANTLTKIKMYYDSDTNTTTTSNGVNTYSFYDNFCNNATTSSKWNMKAGAYQQIQEKCVIQIKDTTGYTNTVSLTSKWKATDDNYTAIFRTVNDKADASNDYETLLHWSLQTAYTTYTLHTRLALSNARTFDFQHIQYSGGATTYSSPEDDKYPNAIATWMLWYASNNKNFYVYLLNGTKYQRASNWTATTMVQNTNFGNLSIGSWADTQYIQNVTEAKAYTFYGNDEPKVYQTGVEETKPSASSITIDLPGSLVSYNSTNVSLKIQVSNTSAIDKYWYKLNGGSSVFFTPNTTLIAKENALNNLSVFVNVSDGTVSNTNVSFYVDTKPPYVLISLPSGSYANYSNIPLNFTANDTNAGLDKCWYNIDNTANYTMGSCLNISINMTGGSHNVTVWANDTLGWKNSSSVIFFISGLNLSVFINGTSSALTNWEVKFSNGTANQTFMLQDNWAWFGYAIIPYGNSNITISDGNSSLYYHNLTFNATNNATNYQQVNIYLQVKSENPITLSSSPSWTIGENVMVNVSCTSPESASSILRKDTITVSNPYSAVMPFGTYVFNCTVGETISYGPASKEQTLMVSSGGFGCTNMTTYAFKKTVSVVENITMLNFTSLVNEYLVRADLKDVWTNVTVIGKNTTDGYYLIVNHTNAVSSIDVYFGNYISNNSYSEKLKDGTLSDVGSLYIQINSYYFLTFVDEITGNNQMPPDANTTVSLICSQGISSFVVNTTKIIVPTFDSKVDEIKIGVSYSPTEQYFRNYLIDAPVEFINAYVVDANKDQIAQLLLSLNDQTGQCSNSDLIVKKYMEGTLERITEHTFDTENKVILYLISGDKYQIYVDCDIVERNMGYLYIDPIDLTKTITLGSIIALNTTSGNFSYNLTYINATHSVYFAVMDTSSFIALTEIWIYNYTGNVKGNLLYYANSTNVMAADFTYVVPNTNMSYLVEWHVRHDFWGQNSMGGSMVFVLFGISIPFPLPFPFSGTLPIPWPSMAITIMTIGGAMIFGAAESKEGAIIIVLLSSLWYFFGWWELNAVVLGIVITLLVLHKMTANKYEA